MTVNTNFNSQGSATPVAGGYAQPAAGITEAIVTPADVSGNAYATSLASAGVANLQTAAYRDSIITVQAGSKASAPTAGAAVVSITPGVAGLWEVSGLVAITGTTVATLETNNLALNAGTVAAIANITFPVTGTTGSTNIGLIPATVLSLGASTAVSVTAVASATASSVYSATLVARRVG